MGKGRGEASLTKQGNKTRACGSVKEGRSQVRGRIICRNATHRQLHHPHPSLSKTKRSQPIIPKMHISDGSRFVEKRSHTRCLVLPRRIGSGSEVFALCHKHTAC
jgi:hypothetical protein